MRERESSQGAAKEPKMGVTLLGLEAPRGLSPLEPVLHLAPLTQGIVEGVGQPRRGYLADRLRSSSWWGPECASVRFC